MNFRTCYNDTCEDYGLDSQAVNDDARGIVTIPGNVGSGIVTLPGNVGSGIVPPIGTLPPDNEIEAVPPIGIAPLPPIQFPNGNQLALRVCMEKVTHMWLRNGEEFWYYPTEISNNTLKGYRYSEQAGWFLYDVPLVRIQNIMCTQ